MPISAITPISRSASPRMIQRHAKAKSGMKVISAMTPSRDSQEVRHWLSARHAHPAEVRLYDRLFTSENPAAEAGDFKEYLNPDSLKVITGIIEPGLTTAKASEKFQFERIGYFCADLDTTESKPVFNRTVGLRESSAKQA